VRPEKREPTLATPAPQIQKTYPARMIASAPASVKENLERRIAADLVNVLEGEVPDLDPVVVGFAIAREARRRREAQA
jgi:hypothetical protein